MSDIVNGYIYRTDPDPKHHNAAQLCGRLRRLSRACVSFPPNSFPSLPFCSVLAQIVLVLASAALVAARPEPPRDTYSAPPPSSYQPSGSGGGYGAPAPQYGPPQQPPVVHKHVYVHVPPPEPEYQAPR